MNVVLIAFLLTLFAGLSTGIGSAIPFFFKTFRPGYLAFFLGLSAGVMIFVSFAGLLPTAVEEVGTLYSFIAFFIGIVVVILLDFLIPKKKNPHHMTREKELIQAIQRECSGDEDCSEIGEKEKNTTTHASRVTTEIAGQSVISEDEKKKALKRTGVLTAIAIALHNFPEGIATFAATLGDVNVGISIAIAIAIHNIPEGISVSIPIYYATKSKWKSFGLSFASGLAEPLGAVFAYLIFMSFLNSALIAASLAFVAGIMVYISIDELLPVAFEYGKTDLVMGGVVSGMVVMASSLILFEYFG